MAHETSQAVRRRALAWWHDIKGADHLAPMVAFVPVAPLGVGIGFGRSMAAKRAAAELALDFQAEGLDRTVVLAVPRHDLAAEQVAAFEALPVVQRHQLNAGYLARA